MTENNLKITTLQLLKKLVVVNIPFFLFLSVICFAVYANVLNGQFISGDDVNGYVLNPDVKDVRKALVNADFVNLRYGIVMSLFGLNSTVLHILAVLNHVIMAFLVFILAFLLFNKKTAVISSVLFSLHPINIEAVSWISGSLYSTLAFFVIVTLILYVVYKNSGNKLYLVLSLVAYLAGIALMRSVWVLLASGLVVIMDQFLLEKKINIKSAIKTWPYFLAAGAAFLVLFTGQLSFRVTNLQSTYTLYGSESTPLINRLPYTIFMYIKTLFIPTNLSLYHEEIIPQFIYLLMVIVTIIFLLFLAVLRTRDRKTFGLILIIFGSLLPVFSPVIVSWFFAERYAYLGSAFFCMIVATFLIKVEKEKNIKDLAKIITILIALIFSAMVVTRNFDWQNSKTLWKSTQLENPYSPRVYNNLGDAYSTEGNFPAAIGAFTYATKLLPQYADAYHNLGYTYMQTGELAKAEENLLTSYQINPALYQSTYKLGLIEAYKGNKEKAKEYFELTLKINPGEPYATAELAKLTQPGK